MCPVCTGISKATIEQPEMPIDEVGGLFDTTVAKVVATEIGLPLHGF